MDQDMSQSGSDVDAEGSEDADYVQIPSAPPVRDITVDPPTPDSSSSIGQNGKRKHGANEQEFMRQDPELYGLRRSVRSTFRMDKALLANISISGPRSQSSSTRMS
jgi:chromodomain-helicase-DNA-binding protein 1